MESREESLVDREEQSDVGRLSRGSTTSVCAGTAGFSTRRLTCFASQSPSVEMTGILRANDFGASQQNGHDNKIVTKIVIPNNKTVIPSEAEALAERFSTVEGPAVSEVLKGRALGTPQRPNDQNNERRATDPCQNELTSPRS